MVEDASAGEQVIDYWRIEAAKRSPPSSSPGGLAPFDLGYLGGSLAPKRGVLEILVFRGGVRAP